jgi:hypothetical protein
MRVFETCPPISIDPIAMSVFVPGAAWPRAVMKESTTSPVHREGTKVIANADRSKT